MFSILNKVFIFLILLFFVYLIASLIIKRKLTQKKIEKYEELKKAELEKNEKDLQEGFTFNTQSGELDSLKINDGSLVMVNTSPKKSNLPLREYYIKASYNTALTGNYINTDMVKYVLSRGCRFLDFEVYSIDNIPYVSYSTDPTFYTQTENTVLLTDILTTISQSGFMAPSPNPQDPLFLQFRIKTTNSDLYSQIAMSLEKNLGSRLYSGQVNGSTLLSNLLGKIIIIVDKSISPNYYKYSDCNSKKYNLKKYVNIESSSNNLRIFKYSHLIGQQTTPIFINDDGITTSSNYNINNTMKLVVPDIAYNIIGIARNPSPFQIITDYGVQIMAYRFYQVDKNLQAYEKIFSDNKCAFIPMAQLLNYINSQSE